MDNYMKVSNCVVYIADMHAERASMEYGMD